jgi:hypothetical protein
MSHRPVKSAKYGSGLRFDNSVVGVVTREPVNGLHRTPQRQYLYLDSTINDAA